MAAAGSRLERLQAELAGRRSIRRWRPEPVPSDLLAELLIAAAWAPSAGNRQAWRLLVVEEPARIAALVEAVRTAGQEVVAAQRGDLAAATEVYLRSFLHFGGAPLLIAPIFRTGVDLLRTRPSVPLAEAEGETGVPRHVLDAVSSVAAAIQNLLLAAHAAGLGGCWMTGPLVARAALRGLLEVPAGWELAALVPIGWPDEQPAPPPRRGPDRLTQRLTRTAGAVEAALGPKNVR